MVITDKTVADKLSAYLHHRITLEKLVDWAEDAMMDGIFDPKRARKIRPVVARLGLADVKAFGLAWDDCKRLLKKLGYAAHVDVVRV